MNVFTLRRLAVAMACGAGTLVLGTAGPASAAGSCVVLDPLTETAHSTFYDNGTPGEDPGDRVTFHNEIFDASGAQIGTSDGGALLFAGSNGGLYERIAAVDTFADGRVSWTGNVLISSAASGADQAVGALGVTGRYHGKSGTRHFRVVGSPGPGVTTFASSLNICG